jgi:hypothetical protein
MLGEFETVQIDGERLIRVRLFDSRYGVANLQGRRWPSCVFDEVTTEAVALQLSFDLWRDVVPCWMRIHKKVRRSPIEALMHEFAADMTRDEYIRWNNLGKDVTASPEEEAELPTRFQSAQMGTRCDNDRTDWVDQEVAEELIRYRKQVGHELTGEEIQEIHQSPRMHGWIRFCKVTHEHNSARLRTEGWV